MFENVKTHPLNIKHYPKYDFEGEYAGVCAITYDGMPITTDDGVKKTKVFAYIGFPEKYLPTENNKMPGIVLVHGGGGHAFAKWVKMWNDRGYAAIAMDTTGDFPEKPGCGTNEGGAGGTYIHGPHDVFAEDGYAAAPGFSDMKDCGLEPVDKHWMYHAISDCLLAHRLLAEDERVDENNIGITGISWGGIITSLVIGYDSALKFAVPVYGSGYLGEDCSMGFCARCFKHEASRKLYLAENRFHNVTFPTLWLCSDFDAAFSVEPNSLSYRDTKDLNPMTRLSTVHRMGHSHNGGWNPPCIMNFADAVVYGGITLPYIGDMKIGDEIVCDVSCEGECSAVLYYMDAPMAYSKDERNGRVDIAYPDRDWKTVECKIENGRAYCARPDDAVGMYMALKTTVNGGEFIVSSQYIEIK